MIRTYRLLIALLLMQACFAEISNIKALNLKNENVNIIKPVHLKMIFDREDNPLEGGFNDLIDYIVPSPYQDNAGSCLYMSHTGIIEWWLNKLDEKTGDDKVNLSERYYMALKTEKAGREKVENWRTDNIERLNAESIMYLNSDYRFTKGYFKKVDGVRVASYESDKDAVYSARYNWLSLRKELDKSREIKLPKFKRIIILADIDKNQWNVATAPLDIVDQVKNALIKNQAPVLVIYNHQGFWHANIIFGFNDNTSTDGCKFVSGFLPKMKEKSQKLKDLAEKAKTVKRKNKLLAKAKRFIVRGTAVSKRFNEIGGCSKKGVFYVRDSIYPNKDMPSYDYDLNNQGEEEHLNSPLILREYEWLTTTANHVIQIVPINE